jgi:CII-binding regulator of phage lambda lysogenization HflD
VQFLESEYEAMRLGDLKETIKKLDDLRLLREQTAERHLSVRNDFERALDSKSKRLAELFQLQSEKQACLQKIDALRVEKYRAIMHSDEPEGTHIMKHLVHEKRCPYCDADLESVVQERETKRLCIFCGNEIAAPKVRGIEELNNAISDQENRGRKLADEILRVGSEIQEIDNRLVSLNSQIETVRASEQEISSQFARFKDAEELRQRAQVTQKELGALRERIKVNAEEYERLKGLLDKLEEEQEEISSLQEKGRVIVTNRIKEVLVGVGTKFTEFVRAATNGEVEAELSSGMLPSLKGRKIYSADDVSQFERSILDMAFRIAVISRIAESGGFNPLLVLETPDQIADESYLDHLAEALARFSKNMSTVVTSSNTRFMKALLRGYKPPRRKERLIDLSVSGAPTQRLYYSPLITEWIGG